ncbi:MAG: adenylate kinase [Actinomycetota bacterium]|nr:adenylate kinase [Actinomycetota bacterium]
MATSGPKLVVLGKQGAGKGTQCVRLARHYQVPHISSGDMFRAELKSGSEAGRRLNEYMQRGDFVPDEVVLEVMARRLGQDDAIRRGFILDGFPRSANQAEALAKVLDPFEVDLAVDLQVPTEVVLRRLAGRRVCTDCGANYSVDTPPAEDWTCDVCGGQVVQRADDTVDVIRRRLELYEQQTEPVVAWYLTRDQLVAVDGLGTPDAVTERLVRAIERRLARRR